MNRYKRGIKRQFDVDKMREMYFVDKKTYKEIAKHFNCSPSYVGILIHDKKIYTKAGQKTTHCIDCGIELKFTMGGPPKRCDECNILFYWFYHRMTNWSNMIAKRKYNNDDRR